MEKTHVLLKCSFDYADEFNCESLVVMTKAEWEKYQFDLKEAFAKAAAAKAGLVRPPGIADWKWRRDTELEITVCFGTNEELRFGDAEDVLRQINEEPITTEEAGFLTRVFRGSTYGTADTAVYRVLEQLNDRLTRNATIVHS